MFELFIYIILIITLINIIIRLSKNIVNRKVNFDDEMNEYILFNDEDCVNEMKELDKIYKEEEIYKIEKKSLLEKIKSVFLL